jgi:hypothetical protein
MCVGLVSVTMGEWGKDHTRRKRSKRDRKGPMKENSSTSSAPAAKRLTSAADDELMAALLTTDKAGLRRLVVDTYHVIGPKRSVFVLFERCEAAHDRFTVRAPCRAQRGLVRRSAYPSLCASWLTRLARNRRQAASGNKHHSITEGNIAHVTRPRPQLLHLARRLWHR